MSTGETEAWIRKNITQTTALFDDGESLEYVYDEVYFRTSDPAEQIMAYPEKYWQLGASWKPEVPLTQDQKIKKLQEDLVKANAALEESKANNDMAIAELTIAMAAMIGGE